MSDSRYVYSIKGYVVNGDWLSRICVEQTELQTNSILTSSIYNIGRHMARRVAWIYKQDSVASIFRLDLVTNSTSLVTIFQRFYRPRLNIDRVISPAKIGIIKVCVNRPVNTDFMTKS